jgi:hypothetical protein
MPVIVSADELRLGIAGLRSAAVQMLPSILSHPKLLYTENGVRSDRVALGPAARTNAQ